MKSRSCQGQINQVFSITSDQAGCGTCTQLHFSKDFSACLYEWLSNISTAPPLILILEITPKELQTGATQKSTDK